MSVPSSCIPALCFLSRCFQALPLPRLAVSVRLIVCTFYFYFLLINLKSFSIPSFPQGRRWFCLARKASVGRRLMNVSSLLVMLAVGLSGSGSGLWPFGGEGLELGLQWDVCAPLCLAYSVKIWLMIFFTRCSRHFLQLHDFVRFCFPTEVCFCRVFA